MAVALGHYCKVHANWEDLNQGFSCIFHLSQLWKKFGLDQVKVNWKLGPWLVNLAGQPIICLEPDHVNLFWKHKSIGNQEERDLWLVDLSSQPIKEEAWFQIDLGMFPIHLFISKTSTSKSHVPASSLQYWLMFPTDDVCFQLTYTRSIPYF